MWRGLGNQPPPVFTVLLTTSTAVFLSRFPVVVMAVKLRQEAYYFLALESSIIPVVSVVCLYPSLVSLAPQSIGITEKAPGRFPHR